MSSERERAYREYVFQVSIEGGDADGAHGGFTEVTGLEMEREAEQRARDGGGNSGVRVTLKRGVFGDGAALRRWLEAAREGTRSTAATKLIVRLVAEDRATVARTWTLVKARPVKYTGPDLNGRGNEIVVETLELTCEGIETE